MTDENEITSDSTQQSLSVEEVTDKFWDMYSVQGITGAQAWLKDFVDDDMDRALEYVPAIVKSGYENDVDMPAFLAEIQGLESKEEVEDAPTDTDGGGISSDGDHQDGDSEDEAQSAQERADACSIDEEINSGEGSEGTHE